MTRFASHYIAWREKRVKKIEKIFGQDFFKNKTILELACGYGDIGRYFREKLGSIVTFAEGREEHIPYIRERNPNSDVFVLNQELNWDLNHKFNIIIHFGVLYHLDNWKQDLSCAIKHSDILILESEVADTHEIKEYKFIDVNAYDQAVSESRIASRPSAAYIEKEINFYGGVYHRFDDADLNCPGHIYDWAVSGSADNKMNYNRNDDMGKRRFWVIFNKNFIFANKLKLLFD